MTKDIQQITHWVGSCYCSFMRKLQSLAWQLHILHETVVARIYSVCGLLNVLWKSSFRVKHYFRWSIGNWFSPVMWTGLTVMATKQESSSKHLWFLFFFFFRFCPVVYPANAFDSRLGSDYVPLASSPTKTKKKTFWVGGLQSPFSISSLSSSTSSYFLSFSKQHQFTVFTRWLISLSFHSKIQISASSSSKFVWTWSVTQVSSPRWRLGLRQNFKMTRLCTDGKTTNRG